MMLTHSVFPMKICTSVSHDHKDRLPCFNTNSIVKMAKSCFKSLVFSSPPLLLWFYLLYFWQSLHLSLLFVFIFEMLRNRSDSEADFFWPDWIHGGLLTVWVSSPTFLIFSSSCCLASLAICSSLILSSSSSCSACCFSRSSLRFCRASRCGAGLPWRSRVTQFWTAETWISHKKIFSFRASRFMFWFFQAPLWIATFFLEDSFACQRDPSSYVVRGNSTLEGSLKANWSWEKCHSKEAEL